MAAPARTDRPTAAVRAPFGAVTVHVVDGVLEFLHLSAEPLASDDGGDPLVRRVCAELVNYFEDARHVPELPPLAVPATAFQRRVRDALVSIPVGQTRSYGDLADALGSTARAVGGACRTNPLPILVPCHRVVARHGPGGFMGRTAGPALDIKTWLLRHELEATPHAGRLL